MSFNIPGHYEEYENKRDLQLVLALTQRHLLGSDRDNTALCILSCRSQTVPVSWGIISAASDM